MKGSTLSDGVIASMLVESPPELTLTLMVKGTLILAAVFLSVFVIRRQAAAIRHFVWSLSFVGLALLPLLSVLVPPIPVDLLPALTEAAAPLPGTATELASQSLTSMSAADSVRGDAPTSVVGSLEPDGDHCLQITRVSSVGLSGKWSSLSISLELWGSSVGSSWA